MDEADVQRIFFGAVLLAVTAAFVWLIQSFLQPIFWAVALGIVVFPLHQKLLRRLNGRRSLTATISMLVVVLIVVMPLLGVAAAVATEATGLYDRLRSGEIDLGGATEWFNDRLPIAMSWLEVIGVDPGRLQEQASTAAVAVSQFIASRAVAIGQDTLRFAVYFFLMLYLLFFFLRDGRRMLDCMVRALPLGDERERHLFSRFAEVSRATIKGTLVVGIVQGAIGGMAFAMLGIGAPVLWGVIMALLSIVPAVGPALVWGPAAIVLLANGSYVAGIVLILVGVLVIGLVDNLLRPVLVGRDTQMPDYLILLSTLGGLGAFGLAGIVIGPIIAAFFVSVWDMAVEEFSAEAEPIVDEQARPIEPETR